MTCTRNGNSPARHLRNADLRDSCYCLRRASEVDAGGALAAEGEELGARSERGGRDAQAAGRLHLHAAVVARDDTQFGEQAHANRRPAQLHCSRRALAVLDAVAARE